MDKIKQTQRVTLVLNLTPIELDRFDQLAAEQSLQRMTYARSLVRKELYKAAQRDHGHDHAAA